MDGISISNAMKGVIAAQTEKDDSTSAKTYAATDLIQLYANDGTPNGKINRTDFMNAVQASLGSILNGGTAQTTGITKVPSLVGNALGATTLENLASVLGGNLGIKRITTPEMNTGKTYTFSGITGGLFLLVNPSGLMGSMLAFVSYNSIVINYITRDEDFVNVSLSKQGNWSNVVLTNNTTRSASTHFEIIHIGIEE